MQLSAYKHKCAIYINVSTYTLQEAIHSSRYNNQENIEVMTTNNISAAKIIM